jgi:lipopolysaccharide biosynthesis protein
MQDFTELTRHWEMTHWATAPNACTDEELHQALAGVLVRARGEVLNDSEVQQFWQIHQEIQRRCQRPGAAA